jgi:hypothetical protein
LSREINSISIKLLELISMILRNISNHKSKIKSKLIKTLNRKLAHRSNHFYQRQEDQFMYLKIFWDSIKVKYQTNIKNKFTARS